MSACMRRPLAVALSPMSKAPQGLKRKHHDSLPKSAFGFSWRLYNLVVDRAACGWDGARSNQLTAVLKAPGSSS